MLNIISKMQTSAMDNRGTKFLVYQVQWNHAVIPGHDWDIHLVEYLLKEIPPQNTWKHRFLPISGETEVAEVSTLDFLT